MANKNLLNTFFYNELRKYCWGEHSLEQSKKCFVLLFLAGMLMTGTAFPAIAAEKDSIIGRVSNVKEGTGTLKIVKDIIDVDANGSRIRKKGKKSATLSDISVGNIVRIKGISDISGIII